MLRAAAAAGARVDDDLLAELVELPPRELAAALREALAHHLLTTDPRDGRLAFRHELVREAAYAELLPGERRRLHAACARVLEERPELGESPASAAASVARHWDAAGTPAGRSPPACARPTPRSASMPRRGARALPARARAVGGCRSSRSSSRAADAAVQAGEAGVAVALLDEALALADPAAEPVRAGILHSQRAWYSWAAGIAGPATHEHHASALALIPRRAAVGGARPAP